MADGHTDEASGNGGKGVTSHACAEVLRVERGGRGLWSNYHWLVEKITPPSPLGRHAADAHCAKLFPAAIQEKCRSHLASLSCVLACLGSVVNPMDGWRRNIHSMLVTLSIQGGRNRPDNGRLEMSGCFGCTTLPTQAFLRVADQTLRRSFI